MKPRIKQRPLSYVRRLKGRNIDDIKLVVIHCTELPDLAMARIWGKKVLHPESQTGNSGHFYIDRNGSIEAWVPINRIAHHVRGFNPQSIGIELVNSGRYPNWFKSAHQTMTEPYPHKQIEALVALLNHLETQLTGLENVTGHEDIDTGMQASEDQPNIKIRRKLDPGICFPWSDFLNKISLSHLTSEDL